MPDPVLEKDKDIFLPHFMLLKASAGSGKTHTLTKRYVQFLLSDKIPQNKLRNILAVTFSNNAAKEMKERVLQWLKGICLNDPAKISEVEEIVSLKGEEVVEKSGKLIDLILNNYSDFQVRTLDSFMTTVFKSSAIDFGYNPDFDILMNNDTVMEYAFNRFLRGVKENTERGKLLEEVSRLALENKGKSSSYNWEPSTAILGEVKKVYRKLSSIDKKVNVIDYSKDADLIKEKIISQINRLESLIKESGLVKSKGSSYNGIFESVKNRRFPDLIGKGLKLSPVKKPLKKSSSDQKAYEQINGEWQKLEELIKVYTNFFARSYYSPYLKFHNAFREILEEIKKIEGKIFIEDINKKLSTYINSNTVPDVYFRIGDTVFHYLIDEFQDTSPLQWINLYPLIENSISEGGSLFVVGDTKQSIYLFRDADYRIMKEFESISPFPSAKHLVKELGFNYRSRKKIVDYNETVFKERLPLTEYSGPAEKSGLNNYHQEVKNKNDHPGYVEVSIIAKSDDSPEKEKIQKLINELIKRGYSYGDIAVLTSKNENVIKVSAWLNEADIPLVSYSSLDVSKRKITGEIVSLLNFLNSPPDDLAFATFCLGDVFSRVLQKKAKINHNDIHSFFFKNRGKSPLYKSFQLSYKELWEIFFERLFKSSGYLPLYELVCEIFSVFSVFENFEDEEATLVKILEVIKDFEGKGSNSLTDFLGYSEESGDELWNINVPEGVDAVKVMTVHKSKGLGFPVVINLLYGEKLDKPLDYIVDKGDECATLLKITKNIKNSNQDFEPLYDENRTRERVNRLNSLYVGFTRARYELYVIGVKGDRDKFPFDILPVEKFKPTAQDKGHRPQKSKESEKLISAYHHNKTLQYPMNTTDMAHIKEIKRGEFIHKILSYVEYVESVNGLEKRISDLAEKLLDGTSNTDFFGEIIKVTTKFLLDERVRKYFIQKPGRVIKNEQEFVDDRGRLLRMDRIIIDKESVTVIDFKTGKENVDGKRYKAQLNGYMKTLSQIYSNKTVKGVLANVDAVIIDERQITNN